MNTFIEKALHGNMDSDRHLVSIFAMALASRGKVFVELGVREGHTTEPLLLFPVPSVKLEFPF